MPSQSKPDGFDSSPKVGAKNVAAKPLPLTLGEVALRSNDGEGAFGLTNPARASIIRIEKVLTGKRLAPHLIRSRKMTVQVGGRGGHFFLSLSSL